MDVMNILFLVVGAGIGYVLFYVNQRRMKYLYEFVKSVKKKKPIIFLETDKANYFRTIERTYKNLGITPEKEIIIIPGGSLKPTLNLGGVPIAHGDLYKSITTVRELRMLIDDLLKEGWTSDDIATFFKNIEIVPPSNIVSFFESMKSNGGNDKLNKAIDVYKALPSTVKDFIYSGVNRVSLHAMIREMVYQRELEKVGQRNWLAIAIAIFIILIAIGMMMRFVFGTPGVTETIGGAIGARIAP